MGGYGAVMLGMKHPDVFSALFALSPCCLVMEDDMSEANPAWSKVLSLSSREQLKTQPMNAEEFYNSAFVALAAAFSPNPTRAPFYVDFPFETKAGLCSQPASPDALKTAPCVQRVEAPYLKWRASFPTYIAEANKANLMKLRGIFIDYGEKEQFVHIRTGVQAFSKALSVLNVPHQFEVYPEGDHGSRIRLRMETRVIEFFNEKLVFEK
jgi:S-formylglutathione hydrolase FrmB